MAKYSVGIPKFNDIPKTIGYGQYGICVYKDGHTIAHFHGENPVELKEKAKKYAKEMDKLPPLQKVKY